MRALAIIVLVGGLVGAASADWNPGDPYAMQFPQLPDPDGWDVNLTHIVGTPPHRVVADDWESGATGPITAIHFWGSWQQDLKGQIAWIDAAIYSDVPSGPEIPYSRPGQLLWSQSFAPGQFTERLWGSGSQGWYDPFVDPPQVVRPDHQQIWQYNIENIGEPGSFEQQQGTIYWLALSVRLVAGGAGQFGWKTSLDHFNDTATWVDLPPAGPVPWNRLTDPESGDGLDMAFVLVPEPAALLGLLLATLTLRRR